MPPTGARWTMTLPSTSFLSFYTKPVTHKRNRTSVKDLCLQTRGVSPRKGTGTGTGRRSIPFLVSVSPGVPAGLPFTKWVVRSLFGPVVESLSEVLSFERGGL